MSALDELNKLLKNSKFIPQEKKESYEKKIKQVDPEVDKLKNIFGMK
jgi:hypothetical protein